MYKKIISTLFILLTLTAAVAFAESGEVFTITAYGEGEVAAAPDAASVVLSVKTRENTAKAAQSANAKTANSVIAAVKNFGIAGEDIKTSRYTVYPVYDNANRKIVGYFAENSVTIKIKGADKAGDVIDAALNAGANQVSSIKFYKSNAKALENEALTLAIKNAREQADITARALGVKIVGIKRAEPRVNHHSAQNSRMLMKAAANDATPIEAGEVFVTASATVEFIIR
ncbi:MAG: SIMPL domain-containing protein [Selenomonadaceae bacterium]|nr:SIMPL domain-containing protein [Selenomonadaceae bacterium]